MQTDSPVQALTLIPAARVLLILILCGLMGLLGQGVRAAVGLKGGGALSQGLPGQQNEFNAAYLSFSLMIGAVAGILAGLVIGPQNFNAEDTKTLLGVAASGYAGADFIENTYSIFFPNASRASKSPGNTVNSVDVQTVAAHVSALNTTVSSLTTALNSTAGNVLHVAVAAPPTFTSGLASALGAVAPHVDASVWIPQLSAAFAKYSMLSNKRMAAAMGQFLVEAGSSFKEIVENLNYTHASRIVAVFPREFSSEAEAQPYVGNPVGLANRVYANKLGNGDESSGGGYRFCGRGLIQLTGRNEYTRFGASVGVSPEQASQYLETPAGAAMSGCWYLSSNGCLPFADSWNISEITRRVNGSAMEGNSIRIAYSNAFLQSLNGQHNQTGEQSIGQV
jgi:predicted chitinase